MTVLEFLMEMGEAQRHTVTYFTRRAKQPHGGYLPLKLMQKIQIDDDFTMYPADEENLYPSIVGELVEALTAYLTGEPAEQAFGLPEYCDNLDLAVEAGMDDPDWMSGRFPDSFVSPELTDAELLNVCEFFTQWHAVSRGNKWDGVLPNAATLHNLRVMAFRAKTFFDVNGPVVEHHFDFAGPDYEPYNPEWKSGKKLGEDLWYIPDDENSGYDDKIWFGWGDFLTADTIWDMKVSKNKLTTKHTLQVVAYWILGKRSRLPKFENVSKVGLYNPRLNCAYVCVMGETLSMDDIKTIDREVIEQGNYSIFDDDLDDRIRRYLDAIIQESPLLELDWDAMVEYAEEHSSIDELRRRFSIRGLDFDEQVRRKEQLKVEFERKWVARQAEMEAARQEKEMQERQERKEKEMQEWQEWKEREARRIAKAHEERDKRIDEVITSFSGHISEDFESFFLAVRPIWCSKKVLRERLEANGVTVPNFDEKYKAMDAKMEAKKAEKRAVKAAKEAKRKADSWCLHDAPDFEFEIPWDERRQMAKNVMCGDSLDKLVSRFILHISDYRNFDNAVIEADKNISKDELRKRFEFCGLDFLNFSAEYDAALARRDALLKAREENRIKTEQAKKIRSERAKAALSKKGR